MPLKRARGASTTAYRKKSGNAFRKNCASKLPGLKTHFCIVALDRAGMLGAMASALPDATALAFPEAQPVHSAPQHRYLPVVPASPPVPLPSLFERVSSGHTQFVVFFS